MSYWDRFRPIPVLQQLDRNFHIAAVDGRSIRHNPVHNDSRFARPVVHVVVCARHVA